MSSVGRDWAFRSSSTAMGSWAGLGHHDTQRSLRVGRGVPSQTPSRAGRESSLKESVNDGGVASVSLKHEPEATRLLSGWILRWALRSRGPGPPTLK
jgi:hypothetical protein